MITVWTALVWLRGSCHNAISFRYFFDRRPQEARLSFALSNAGKMALDTVKVHTTEQLVLLLVSIFSAALATTAVVLRVISHRIKRAPLGLDDWAIFVALVQFHPTDIAYPLADGLALHLGELYLWYH